MDRLAEREPESLARLIAGVPHRARMAPFALDAPDEARAISAWPSRCADRGAAIHRARGGTRDPHR
jgi:hypothetical protein